MIYRQLKLRKQAVTQVMDVFIKIMDEKSDKSKLNSEKALLEI